MGMRREQVREQDEIVLSAYLSRESFAAFLVYLMRDTEAYLGILQWRSVVPVRRKRKRAIVDAHTPLVANNQDGTLELLIPDWQRVRSLDLLMFYKDGSILSARLGVEDTLEVVRGEPGSSAAQKVAGAKAALRSGRRQRAWRLYPAILFLTMAAVVSLLPAAWVFRARVLYTIALLLSVLFAVPASAGRLRPRENWVGVGWRSLEWTKAIC
jgi:hypothetical protein